MTLTHLDGPASTDRLRRHAGAREALALALVIPLSVALTAQAGRPARHWTPAPIASDQYESTPTFTPDGRELFFMRSDRNFGNYRILWSRCQAGGWTAPTEPAFAAARGVLDADPFVTADGRRLYFVSSRADPRNDDLDIFYVERAADGQWGAAQRLAAPVSSAASELLPRQTADGRLYFGSQRPGGYGGTDIYVATPDSAGAWRVENLGPAVNSAAHEYEVDVSQDGRTLVLVADRGDRSHLYRYEQRDGRWLEQGRIPAARDVFQVGPLLAPHADRLLFAQADGTRSGEIFLIDLSADPDRSWPPQCPGRHD